MSGGNGQAIKRTHEKNINACLGGISILTVDRSTCDKRYNDKIIEICTSAPVYLICTGT